MNIKVEVSVLINAFDVLKELIEKHYPYAHVVVEGNKMKLSVTDMTSTASTSIRVSAEGETEFDVDVTLLLQILKNTSDDFVSFDVAETLKVNTRVNSFEFAHPESILKFTPDDANQTAMYSMSKDSLVETIENLSEFGKSNLNPVNAMHFEFREGYMFAENTDSHCYASYKADVDEDAPSEFVLSQPHAKKLLRALKKSEDEVVEIKVLGTKGVLFLVDGYTIYFRSVNIIYPNVEKQLVAPKTIVNVVTDEFVEALKQLDLIQKINNETAVAMESLDEKLKLTFAGFGQRGSAVIPADIDGDAFVVGIKPNQFLDAVKLMDNENSVQFGITPMNTIRFTNDTMDILISNVYIRKEEEQWD